MGKNIAKTCIIFIFFFILFSPYFAHSQEWPITKIDSLPDSSFAMVEVKKDGTKIRHFAYKDRNGHIDINQLIYCLGTFSDENWFKPGNIEATQKGLQERYYRFKLNQTNEGIKPP